MTLRDDLLPVFNDARELIHDLGLRTSSLTVRTRTWSSGKARMGTSSDSDLVITPRPKIREANGDTELLVGPITPSYSGGGYTPTQLNPQPTLVAGQEVLYVVTSPAGTKTYTAASIDTSKSFGYYLKLTGLERKVPY